jgi:hypothetical protein
LPKTRTAAPADPAQLEAAFKAFAAPGKEHEQFKRLVGTWDAEVVSIHDPTAPPEKAKAKATFRLLLGGRYLQQQFAGESDGQKFEGLGISGYDNAQKKFVGSWIDSVGTGIMHTEGHYNAEKDELVEIGESSSPAGPMKLKMITQYVSDDKMVFTMLMLLPGNQEQKMMEITYTRAKTEGKKKSSD